MGWCTAQWKMLLFCAKTIMKESRKFELAHLKKKKKNEKMMKKKKKERKTFWPPGDCLAHYFCYAFQRTGCAVERFFCISIYYASALSLHIESTDSMIAKFEQLCNIHLQTAVLIT